MAIAATYEAKQQGAGSGVMTAFNVPETAWGNEIPLARYVGSDAVDHALRMADIIGMHQHAGEIRQFALWLATRSLKNVLEIGTLKGGTAALWHELCTGKVISVDLPEGRFGGADHGYTWKAAQQRNETLTECYPRF